MATSFQNKLNDLEARLKAENDERGKGPEPPDFTQAVASPRRPKPLGDFNFKPTRPSPKGLMLSTGLPGEPGTGLQRRRHFHLPCSPQPQKPPDSAEIDQKYQEIMKASGILTLDGSKVATHIDDLESLGELGHGTCGHVVKMRHKKTGHLMAVKQMRRSGNREENKRIIMDLDVVLKSHDCPYIVQCLGTFITTSDVWICMELMSTCLDKLLKRLKAPFPEHILGKVAVATVNALNYLKDEHGVIHRDVKPSNILIDEHGRIKLCDFGISGRLVDSKAKTRSAGCAAYMAPERIDPPDPTKPDYDIRADVWSLGISLVELATGEFPYKNCKTDFEVLTKVLEEDPPVLPCSHGFSMHFCMFVRDCLTKDYRRRPKYRKLLEHPFIKKYEKCFVNVAAWYAGVMGIECAKAQIQQPPRYFARSESYAGTASQAPLLTPLTTPSVDFCLSQPMFPHASSSPSCSDGWPSPQSSTSSRVDFSLGYSPSPSPSPSPSGPFHTPMDSLQSSDGGLMPPPAQSVPQLQIQQPTRIIQETVSLGRAPNYNQIRMFDLNQGMGMDYRQTKSAGHDSHHSQSRGMNINQARSASNINSGHATEFNQARSASFNVGKLAEFDQSRTNTFTQPRDMDFADFSTMETRSESGMDYSHGNGKMGHHHQSHRSHRPAEYNHHHSRGMSLDLGQMRQTARNNHPFSMSKDNGRSHHFANRNQSQNNGMAMSISSHSANNPFTATNMVSSSYPNNSAAPNSNKGSANPFIGNPFKPRNGNPFCDF